MTLRIARQGPFSLTSLNIVYRLKFHVEQPCTIIDGGANIGQFARAASITYPDARIYSVEPLPDVVSKLRNNLKDVRNISILETALGSKDGRLVIYQNDYDQASSALQLKETASEVHRLVRHATHKIEVDVTALDTLDHRHSFHQPILIKLDLQGYEIEALRGATNLLKKTQFVLLEIALTSIYENEPTEEEVVHFMTEAEFDKIDTLNVVRDKSGRDVQLDVLFRKRRNAT